MGRKKIERLPLTPDEKEHAQKLVEDYMPLVEDVAKMCWKKYDLQWKGFDKEDVLDVAYEGFFEAVMDYIRKRDVFSREQKEAYLRNAIEHDIIDYMRHEKRTISLEKVGEIEHPFGEVEVGEYVDIWDALKEYAASLPKDERQVLEKLIRDVLAGQLGTHQQFAEDAGVCRSTLYKLLSTIREKTIVWVQDEYAA